MAAAKEDMSALVSMDVQSEKCSYLYIGSIFARPNINKVEIFVASREAAHKVFNEDGRADNTSTSTGLGQSPTEKSASARRSASSTFLELGGFNAYASYSGSRKPVQRLPVYHLVVDNLLDIGIDAGNNPAVRWIAIHVRSHPFGDGLGQEIRRLPAALLSEP